jgi:hypothetical protein
MREQEWKNYEDERARRKTTISHEDSGLKPNLSFPNRPLCFAPITIFNLKIKFGILEARIPLQL